MQEILGAILPEKRTRSLASKTTGLAKSAIIARHPTDFTHPNNISTPLGPKFGTNSAFPKIEVPYVENPAEEVLDQVFVDTL